jgi:hypothetical protein
MTNAIGFFWTIIAIFLDSRGGAAICTSMSTRPPKEDHLSTERNAKAGQMMNIGG